MFVKKNSKYYVSQEILEDSTDMDERRKNVNCTKSVGKQANVQFVLETLRRVKNSNTSLDRKLFKLNK